MMGILGVVGRAGRPVAVPDLLPGFAAMVRRGKTEVYASADGMAVFARLSRGEADLPHVTTVVDLPVVLDGCLYNQADLLVQLDSEARAMAADDVALVRGLYSAFGVEAFAKLRGQYALALYDPRTTTLHLASDVVGQRSLAFRATAEAAFFAPEQKSVLAMSGARLEPNDAALAELLLGTPTGAFAGGQGLFKGIELLGRGELVSLGRCGIPARARVQEFDLRPHGPRPYAELCAEFRVLFRQAVARSLDPLGTTAITVSGGLDSSSIYCVARALQAEGAATGRIIGINFTAEDGGPADERAYTDAIIKQYGPGIVRVPMQPAGFLDSLLETMRASESPQINPAGNLFQRQYAAAAAGDASRFVTGFWGDELFSPFNYWYHLLWSLRLPTLLRVAHEHHHWITETPVTARDTLGWILRATLKEFTPFWLRRAYRRLKPSSTPAHPLASGRLGDCRAGRNRPLAWRPATRFAQWQRDVLDSPHTRHSLQAFDHEVAAYGMRASHPFLDPDLVQFLLRCDGAQINPGGRYKGLLRDALRQDVPGMILDRQNKGDFTEAYRIGQGRDLVTALGSGGWIGALKQAGYVSELLPEWANDSLDRLTSNSDNVHITAQSTDCVGLGHWLNLFFDRGFEDDVERNAAGGAGQQAGVRSAGPDDLR